MRGGCEIPVEAVAVLKEKYDGFDKPLWSRCRHPEKYGVRLTAEAEKVLAKNGVEIKRKRRDIRSKAKSNRITFRTSEAIFEALQRKAEKDGSVGMQEAMERAVAMYLEAENAAN